MHPLSVLGAESGRLKKLFSYENSEHQISYKSVIESKKRTIGYMHTGLLLSLTPTLLHPDMETGVQPSDLSMIDLIRVQRIFSLTVLDTPLNAARIILGLGFGRDLMLSIGTWESYSLNCRLCSWEIHLRSCVPGSPVPPWTWVVDGRIVPFEQTG